MKIEYLCDRKDMVPTLAHWFYQQWGYLAPDRSMEERIRRLHDKAQRTALPITFVAMEGDLLVGSAGLIPCDMDTRAHLTPWLSSVFVAASSRNQGIGTKLVNRVIGEAARHQFSTIYLWTPDKEVFYAKRGWRVLEHTRYRNEDATIMSFSLRGQYEQDNEDI